MIEKLGHFYLVIGKWCSLEKVKYVLQEGEKLVSQSDMFTKVSLYKNNYVFIRSRLTKIK